MIALATEDDLSEAVGVRLIEDAGMSVGLRFKGGGFGYLRSRMKKWRALVSNGVPLVLLTDLDSSGCASALIRGWSGATKLPEDFLFRVAVREVEAWLLADHLAFGRFLSAPVKVPPDPEALKDPKATLLKLALRAPKGVRRDLVAERGAAAAQGLGYNFRLGEYVVSVRPRP